MQILHHGVMTTQAETEPEHRSRNNNPQWNMFVKMMRSMIVVVSIAGIMMLVFLLPLALMVGLFD